MLIGGHIDSVPNGGWLDGALNVVAGVEVLCRIAAEGTPPVVSRVVQLFPPSVLRRTSTHSMSPTR